MSEGINWRAPECAVVGPDLGVKGLDFTSSLPSAVVKNDRTRNWRGAEEALETILLLHFERFFGARPVRTIVERSMGSEPDLIALDALGRVHIVEAKEGKFDRHAFEQSIQYALRFIFFDSKHDLFEHGRFEEGPREWLAKRIAGVWAGERSEQIGRGRSGKGLAKDDPGLRRRLREHEFDLSKSNSFTARKWQALAPEGRAKVRYEWLFSAARVAVRDAGPRTKRSRVSFPSFEELWESAAAWEARLGASLGGGGTARVETVVDAKCPLVLWLVGSEFPADVCQKIRDFRAVGMDIRPQVIKYRSEPGTKKWFVLRQEEDFPGRSELERKVFERLGTGGTATPEKRSLDFDFYQVKSPSSKRGAADGSPLPQVRATFQSGGKSVKIEV